MAESNRELSRQRRLTKATSARAAVCSRPQWARQKPHLLSNHGTPLPRRPQSWTLSEPPPQLLQATPWRRSTVTVLDSQGLSSTRVAPGARAYSSWLRNKSAVRNVLAKRLSAEHSNNLVLTGTSRMEGQITSLTMVSQSLANHKQAVAAMRKQKCFSAISNVHLSMLASVAKTRFHSRYSIVYREGAEARSILVRVRCNKSSTMGRANS